jgi:anthranilate 1,2-dioxygenase large subunit
VEIYRGVIFGTFAPDAPPLLDYLDPQFVAHLDRVFARPIELLGYQRQRIGGNWKLYIENTRDPYHGGLLHLFQVTFGIFRSTHQGGTRISANKAHSISYSVRGSDKEDARASHTDVTTFKDGFRLRVPEINAYRDEFGDGCGLSIMSVFPNFVLQQICNSFCTRQIRTKGPHEFELYWTFFGYADDTPDMRAHRMNQSNLAGPAGLIAMEDGEAIELVHRNLRATQDHHTFVAMGTDEPVQTSDILVSEIPIRGFWSYYVQLMGIDPGFAA